MRRKLISVYPHLRKPAADRFTHFIFFWRIRQRETKWSVDAQLGESYGCLIVPELTQPGDSAPNVTELLVQWKGGSQEALEELVPLVYQELRRIARYHLRRERPDHTLQSGALVNEAYLRLVDQKPIHTENRIHFLAVSSRLMRQILIDSARSRRAAKRGAEFRVDLDVSLISPQSPTGDIVALDDALNALTRLDEQQGRIVEMRFFAGLSLEEIATVLGISVSTVKRDWNVAKAWLSREMRRGAHGDTRSVAAH
jgi:RNA polymerase sigma factor (TIGR02999 family)